MKNELEYPVSQKKTYACHKFVFENYWSHSDINVWAIGFVIDQLELENPADLPNVYDMIQLWTDCGTRKPGPATMLTADEKTDMVNCVKRFLEIEKLQRLIDGCEAVQLPLRANEYRMKLRQLIDG